SLGFGDVFLFSQQAGDRHRPDDRQETSKDHGYAAGNVPEGIIVRQSFESAAVIGIRGGVLVEHLGKSVIARIIQPIGRLYRPVAFMIGNKKVPAPTRKSL